MNTYRISDFTSKEIRCWVPNCSTDPSKQQKLFSLPDNPKSREIWLALAGKVVTSPDEQICFCSEHFSPPEILKIDNSYFINSLPLKQMPEKICRLCLSIIDSSDDSIYVLSKIVPTEMPSCIEDMLSYFIPSNPEPLFKIVSYCISGLDIQCNPPPLLCKPCFINIWLLYMFKLSAVEVDKALGNDIPLENYSKMVLCRTCPVRSGTNFVSVPEDSDKGQLLKNIFMMDANQKDPLPLRLCTTCFEVVSRLETFYKICQIAEAKMKRHLELERNLAQRKNNLNDFRRMLQNRKQDISQLLKSRSTGTTFEDNNENVSRNFSVDRPTDNTKLSLSQWKKETLATTLLKYGLHLKDEMDNGEFFKGWSLIRGEMVKLGINCEVPELMYTWADLLENALQKFNRNLPLEYLDSLIVKYLKGNNEQITTIPPVENSRLFSKDCKLLRSFQEIGDLQRMDTGDSSNFSCDTVSTSNSSPTRDIDMEPPILSPQNVPSRGRGGAKKDGFWNESREIFLLEFIVKEVFHLKKQFGPNKKIPLILLIRTFLQKHPIFQKYSTDAIYQKVHKMKKDFEKGLYVQSKRGELLKRLTTVLSINTEVNTERSTKNVTASTSASRNAGCGKRNLKQMRIARGKLPGKPFTKQEQLMLIQEMSKEYEIVQKSSSVSAKSMWQYVLHRLEKRKFLNMDIRRLTALWNKVKTSAKIHSKDGDEIDVLTWKLLQRHNDFMKTRSKPRTEKDQEAPSSSKNDEPTPVKNIEKTTENPTVEGTEKDDVSDAISEHGNDDSGGERGGLEDDDDEFEENCGKKDPDNKIEEPPPKVESKPVIKVEKLDLDKLKFVKAIKREFKEMRRKKEPNLKKPFHRILERLAKTKYSKFSSHELKAKWRNMKCIATVHQKKGLLTQLDRAVLGLVNYKNENATYGSVVSSSSDESEASQQESSSESDGEEDNEISDIEGDDDDKIIKVSELILDNNRLLKVIRKKLKDILKEEPGLLFPFRTVFQQICSNTKGFNLLRDKWRKLKATAYEHKKDRKTTPEDEKVLKLVMFSRSQKTQKSLAGVKDVKTEPGAVTVLPKIDPDILIRDVLKEFIELKEETTDYPFPIAESLVRLNNCKYSEYRLNEIERIWMNITQIAYKHRRIDAMSEEDQLYFDILNGTNEYRKSRNIVARSSVENGEGSISLYNTDKKILAKKERKDTAQASTSSGKTDGAASTSRKYRRTNWKDEDLLALFKLIKQEYLGMLKSREPIPATPWPTIIKNIVAKKLFKCDDETELNRLWRKMRQNFTLHENTPDMTPLDWKVSRLMMIYKKNMGVKVKEKEPIVPKKRPRPILTEESENENDNESDKGQSVSNVSKEDVKKIKLELVKILRRFGKEAFIKTDHDRKKSFWPTVKKEIDKFGYNLRVKTLSSYWTQMVTRAKRCMADQIEPNEIDRQVIEFMKEQMRKADDSDREECTREDLKVERMSDDEQQNEIENDGEDGDDEGDNNEYDNDNGDNNESVNDEGPEVESSQNATPNDEHISLKDIEAKEKELQIISLKNESLHIKEPVDPFSDDSSDTVEYFSKDNRHESQVSMDNNPGIDRKDEETVSKEEEIKEEIKEEKCGNDNNKKAADLTAIKEIIDLCSDDVDLEDLLADVNEGDSPWKI